MDEKPYNPLDYDNLGQNVADALLERTVVPLASLPQFSGAGIYALYYTGTFPAYTLLASRNRNNRFGVPIYVGKAVPAGARKGGRGMGVSGFALFKRLSEHALSISQVANLDLADFHCRYLVVEDIWIPLGESLLIERFQPLWNVVVDGFGNHDPGKGRISMQRPLWDMIHPGRPWALRLRENRRSATDILETIRRALAGLPVEQLSEVSQQAEANSDERG